VTAVCFYVLAGLAILAGASMVIQRSPLASALSLVVAMAALAGVYATLHAQALATLQILVYAGAITVLIIFVLMVVDLDEAGLERQRARPGALLAGGLVGAALAVALATVMLPLRPAGTEPLPEELGSLAAAGRVLLGERASAPVGAPAFVGGPLLFAFEVVSLLLLVAMAGAVVLAKRRL
jgi:NADH-quinone oxidoreductase subunit J